MKFIGNSAQIEGGAIYVKAPSVAIDFNISPIFNTGCFIQYEVNTEPFSLEPQDWNVIDDNQPFYLRSSNFFPIALLCRWMSYLSTTQLAEMVLQFMQQALTAVPTNHHTIQQTPTC